MQNKFFEKSIFKGVLLDFKNHGSRSHFFFSKIDFRTKKPYCSVNCPPESFDAVLFVIFAVYTHFLSMVQSGRSKRVEVDGP